MILSGETSLCSKEHVSEFNDRSMTLKCDHLKTGLLNNHVKSALKICDFKILVFARKHY